MSVTFSPENIRTGRAVIVTWDSDEGEFVPHPDHPVYPSYEEAMEVFELAVLSGQLTSAFKGLGSSYVTAEMLLSDAPSVNLANSNAAAIARLLSLSDAPEGDDPFDTYICGQMDAQDFLGRVLVALADDEAHVAEAREAYVDSPEGHATTIYQGRTPDYLRERLEQLAAMAEYAVRLGVPVTWG